MVKKERENSKVLTRSSTKHIDALESDSDEICYENHSSKRKRIRETPSPAKEDKPAKTSSTTKNGRHYIENSPPLRRAARTSRFLNGDLADDGSVRRSTRNRKVLYKNLNQHWLVDEDKAYFPRSPEQKRKSKVKQEENNFHQPDDTEGEEEEEETVSKPSEYEDMYTRVKRVRRKTTSEFYDKDNMKEDISEGEEEESEEEEEGENEMTTEEEEEEEEDEEEAPQRFRYSLRQRNKTVPEQFSPAQGRRRSKRCKNSIYKSLNIFDSSPSSRYKRKPHAIHNGSSSCSDSSDDERRFEHREARSIARTRNRCLPMNYKEDQDLGISRDPAKLGGGVGISDTKPMNVDESITFESIGGLDKHIADLKEMVMFPLLYPEVFAKFKVTPPRGVIFHGPPGTGKTLVARALANEISKVQGVQYSFFMRKGADCFSKWVGESERHIRVLFDQAYQMRPSIIFFDEIDGLAPVRTSRQDQIHCSIVSTLLSVMDGLDSRGEIVVIGATNRIDALDPALRRPGRFDREFHFPLPNLQARQEILRIHTKQWEPAPSEDLLLRIAQRTSGYCGADIKAICAESSLIALRRAYPQIYFSKTRLQLDLAAIQIKECHFERALKKIVPASQRGSVSYIKPLDDYIRPLFQSSFNNVSQFLERVFPQGNPPRQPKKSGTQDTTDYSRIMEWSEDEEENHQVEIMPIENANCLKGSRNNSTHSSLIKLGKPLLSGNSSYRPRLLLCGEGSYNYLAPALLHRMEHIPVHRLDLPTLHLGGGTVEEALCTLWREAQRIPPAVLFLPSLDHWPQELLATLVSLVHLADPRIPTLLLATVGCPISDLPPALLELFDPTSCLTIPAPTLRERREFFMPLLLRELLRPPPELASAKHYPALPEAPLPKPAPPSAAELESLQKEEEKVMRDLRVFLRTILAKLMRDRKFVLFVKPVSPEDAPDYLEVVKNPMCLNVIRCKIDHKQYWSVQDFLNDIDLIYCNALEYNDPIDPIGQEIRHKAFSLKDAAVGFIDSDLNPEFEPKCLQIRKARTERGEKPPEFDATAFYQQQLQPSEMEEVPVSNQKKRPNPLSSSSSSEPETKKPKLSTEKPLPPKHRRKKSLWFGSKNISPKKTPPKTSNNTDLVSSTLNSEVSLQQPASSLITCDTTLTVLSSASRKRTCSLSPVHPSTHSEHDKENLNTNAERILEGETTPRLVTLDTAQARAFYDKLVRTTEGWSADSLIQLYSALNSAIHTCRHQWDKKELQNLLEETLRTYQQ